MQVSKSDTKKNYLPQRFLSAEYSSDLGYCFAKPMEVAKFEEFILEMEQKYS